MKKLMLFSTLVLNLAFGADYTSVAKQCVNGNIKSCERLMDKCHKDNDGDACFALGTVEILAGKVLVETDAYKAQQLVDDGLSILEKCCRELKNKNCCGILKKP